MSNLLENGEKYIEKCNFCIKYFDKIKCYADRAYLIFLKLKPETHIYFFLALLFGIMSPYDPKFYLNINIGLCDLTFMAQ